MADVIRRSVCPPPDLAELKQAYQTEISADNAAQLEAEIAADGE